MNREKRNSIIDLVEGLISETKYECVEVEWIQVDRTLIVYIDGPEPVVMDDCLAVNSLLNESDAVEELISGPFRLDVSSPGIERPLRTVSHFEKVVGQVVDVTMSRK